MLAIDCLAHRWLMIYDYYYVHYITPYSRHAAVYASCCCRRLLRCHACLMFSAASSAFITRHFSPLLLPSLGCLPAADASALDTSSTTLFIIARYYAEDDAIMMAARPPLIFRLLICRLCHLMMKRCCLMPMVWLPILMLAAPIAVSPSFVTRYCRHAAFSRHMLPAMPLCRCQHVTSPCRSCLIRYGYCCLHIC